MTIVILAPRAVTGEHQGVVITGGLLRCQRVDAHHRRQIVQLERTAVFAQGIVRIFKRAGFAHGVAGDGVGVREDFIE